MRYRLNNLSHRATVFVLTITLLSIFVYLSILEFTKTFLSPTITVNYNEAIQLFKNGDNKYQQPKEHLDYTKNLIALNIFGETKKFIPISSNTTIKKTQLHLKLHGLLDANEPGNSIAIISSQGFPEDAYRVGDTLPDGAILEEIYHSQVVIKHNNKLESLDFSINQLNQKEVKSVSEQEPPHMNSLLIQ